MGAGQWLNLLLPWPELAVSTARCQLPQWFSSSAQLNTNGSSKESSVKGGKEGGKKKRRRRVMLKPKIMMMRDGR